MLGKTLNRRYHLEQLIGRSASGPLYLATDVSSGEMLAVKVFPPHVSLNSEEGLRYRRVMARLGGIEHPHVLTPVETGSAEGVVYQVLPYYPAASLADLSPQSPLSLEEGVTALRQAAAGLAALHQAGLTHLNLKPTNLLISREGGAIHGVLTDPARPLLDDPIAVSAGVETAMFRPPEADPWVEQVLDNRSDLYALGVMAYLLLTGRLPLPVRGPSRGGPEGMLSLFPAPRDMDERIPQRLSAIVHKLVARRPRDRYQSARGLVADLEYWSHSTDRMLGSRDVPRPMAADPRLFGRDSAREALLSALAGATSGRGSIILLSGEAGLGKSALVGDIWPQVQASEALFLRSVPPGGDGSSPFALPIGLLMDLLLGWPALSELRRRDLLHRLHQAVGQNGAVLTGLVPELTALLPHAEPLLPLPFDREPLRVRHVFCEAFLALSDPHHPLVLWLGDLSDADGDSVAWLRYLAHRLAEAPLVVLAGYTPGVESPDTPLARWLAHPPPGGTARWVELTPLDEGQSVALLAQRLGMQDGEAGVAREDDLPRRLAYWMLERWGGRPLAQLTALRLLMAKGWLRRATPASGAPRWQCDWEEVHGAPWPESLPGLISHWLELLPDDVMLVAQAAAVFPGAFRFEALADLLDHYPAHLVLERVESAIAEGLLRRGRNGLRFAHPRFRAAVYGSLGQAQRAQYHLIAGAALEADPVKPPLVHHHEAALHFRVAGDTARYIDHGLGAVQAASRHQALYGVERWAGPLQPLLRNDARLPALLIGVGRAHALLGQYEAALGVLQVARALDVDERDALEIYWLTAWTERARGHVEQAVAWVEEALSRVGQPLPANPVGTALARLTGAAARRYESLRRTASGSVLPTLTEDETRLADLLELAALLLAPLQPNLAVLADENILRLTAPKHPSPHLVRALLRLGDAQGEAEGESFRQAREILNQQALFHEAAAYYAAVGRALLGALDLRRAHEALNSARTRFRNLGDPLGEAETVFALVEVARLEGSVMAMEQHAAVLRDLSALLEMPHPAGWAEAASAYTAALDGRLTPDQAGAALRAGAARFNEGGHPDTARHLLVLAGEIALGRGDLAELLACYRAEGTLPDTPPGLFHLLLQAVLAELWLVQAAELPSEREHDLSQARGRLKGLKAWVETYPRLRAETGRLEMMERFLVDDTQAALTLLEDEAAFLESQGARFALARLSFRAAEALKGRDDPRWLHWGGKALTLFGAMGAHLFTARVRTLLELEPPEETPADSTGAGDSRVDMGGASTGLGGSFQGVLARISTEGALPEEALHAAVLERFMRAGEGAFGGLFVPNADGVPALACQQPAGSGGRFNRWLVDTVWRERRGQLLANYRPPQPEVPSDGDAGEACSLVCVPVSREVSGHNEPLGVVMLGNVMSHLVYDHTHLHHLSTMGREAGLVIALNGALRQASAQRETAQREAHRREYLLEWSLAAGSADDLDGLLRAYFDEAAADAGFSGAVLLFTNESGTGLELGALHGGGPLFPEVEMPLPCGPHACQTAEALRRQTPLAVHTPDAPVPSADERAFIEALGARDGVWVPVVSRGASVGLVFLFAQTLPFHEPERMEQELLAPLRLLAPALHRAYRTAGTERGLAAQQAREAALVSEIALLRSLAPPPPPDGRMHAGGVLSEATLRQGVERNLPVLFGEISGLAPLSGLSTAEQMAVLRGYFERVQQGLTLHEGTLAGIQNQHWMAHFRHGSDSALWAAQTLYQLLSAWREEQSAHHAPMLLTGLGVHLGNTLWGAVPAHGRLASFLTGEGVRTASRLAAMCIGFRCGVLVSDAVVHALETPEHFDLRPLGRLRPAPGEGRVGVYELYSVREAPIVQRMRDTQGLWEQSVRLYQRGQWGEAAEGFRGVLEELPHDRPARYFMRQCGLRQRG